MTNQYARVAWSIEDIKDRKPDWTDEQCDAFLTEHESLLQDLMVSRGWDAIDDLLP